MRYLVPRSDVAEIWAAVALGWRWSFTVSQPGLGIVTRVSMGGLKGGRKEGRRRGGEGEQSSKERSECRRGGGEVMSGKRGGGGEARRCSEAFCCVFIFQITEQSR